MSFLGGTWVPLRLPCSTQHRARRGQQLCSASPGSWKAGPTCSKENGLARAKGGPQGCQGTSRPCVPRQQAQWQWGPQTQMQEVSSPLMQPRRGVWGGPPGRHRGRQPGELPGHAGP